MASDLLERLAAQVERHGPVSFATFLELVLYDPEHGFYDGGGGRAGGHRGDFLTSPEVGPLFGVLIGRALDAWWDELGRPDPFVVIEAGAGPGTLARTVRAAAPRCSAALTYVLVERSAHQRTLHGHRLALTEPSHALPPIHDDEPAEPGTGPRFTSLAELPAVRVRGVVLANELLDNLPFHLVERTAEGWSEVRVAVRGQAGSREAVEHLVPATEDLAVLAERLAPDAAPGARLPIQHEAGRWLQSALDLLEEGRVLVLDYADRSASLADRPWHQWVRTFRAHERGGHPLDLVGLQDVTCEVAIDQLARRHAPSEISTQAELLRNLGIDELVEEGRRTWHERAHIGDLAAVAARSRIGEAEALTDPDGLGAFTAMVWRVGR